MGCRDPKCKACPICEQPCCRCDNRQIEPYYSPFHCNNCKGCIGNCTGEPTPEERWETEP